MLMGMLVPFHSIKKGSRLVLYAAGNVGRNYYSQLKATDYANVIMWVDKYRESKSVSPLADLLKLRPDDYDLVLIAVLKKELADDIIVELEGFGLEREKLIFEEPIGCLLPYCVWAQSEITLQDLFCAPFDFRFFRNSFDIYFTNKISEDVYFSDLTNKIKEYAAFSETRQREVHDKTVKLIKSHNFSPKERLVFVRILYRAGCLFSNALRIYAESAALIENETSQRYWLFTDFLFMWFNYPRALYNDLFIELHNISKNLAEKWNINFNPIKYNRINNKKICFLLPFLLEIPTHNKFLSPIVSELIRTGYEVHLVNIEFSLYDENAYFLKPLALDIVRCVDIEGILKKFFPGCVHYHNANARNVRDRQVEILSIIADIDPLCVLDYSMGMGIVTYYICKQYPVINCPFQNAGYASSFFHKVIIPSMEDPFHPPIKAEQVVRMQPTYSMGEPYRIFCRSDYALNENDIVCVTVGTRLQTEITKSLVNGMCEVMAENKNIKWLIVGTEELPFASDLPEGIRFIRYESDLPGLYQICDIYVNPLRVGGGITVAWAVMSGLAIVTPSGAADARTLVGMSNTVKSEDEAVQKVRELAENPIALKHHKECIYQLSKQWDVRVYVKRLTEIMHDLAREFSND